MRTAFVASLGLIALGLASTASAQPPDGRGNGRGHSPDIERALSNRAEVARDRGLSLGSDRGVGQDLRAGAQAGTGRLGTESPWERGRGAGLQDRLADHLGDRTRGRQRGAAGEDGLSDTPPGTPIARRSEVVSHGANRRAATLADGWLANRLATIDHLRDVAMRNGNVQLLEQADQLEAHARQQHLWRTGQIDHPHGELPPEIEAEIIVDVGGETLGDMPMPPPGDDSMNVDGAVPSEFESSVSPEPRRLPPAQ